ncbi:MAG: flavodoxin family protein [Candidatus Omnitrophica bacterium]|nr:flavodoxin family protein [Candidatus Omnitrophota bacterium]
MPKKILIISGSPKKDGNTTALIEWFQEGIITKGGIPDIVYAAFLKYKFPGCTSCRACQKSEKYECVIDDDARSVLLKMAKADIIVMATPLYFFGPSAQLKIIMDRMFSLYKWDNAAGTMKTPLQGKTLILLASAFEGEGLDALEKPFTLIARYTGMSFDSLIIANAGVSGDIRNKDGVKEKIVALGKRIL